MRRVPLFPLLVGALVALPATAGQTSVRTTGRIETADQVASTLPTGTPPLEVASTTRVENLNADLVDGVHGVDLDLRLSNAEGALVALQGDVDALQLARTVVVGPVGSPTDNGTALLAAMASLPTPTSQEEAMLLRIEPGLYDLQSQTLTMKSWVDVAGSGQAVTWITGAVCRPTTTLAGVVVGASHAELRHVTVQNTCSGASDFANAIANNSDEARLLHVTALVTGAAGYNTAVYNEGLDVVMTHVNAVANNGTAWNRGVVDGGTRVVLRHVRAFASSTGSTNTGLELFGGHTMVIDAVATAAGGTDENLGVFNAATDPTLVNVVATAPSGSGDRIGLYGIQGAFRMEGGIAGGEDGMVLDWDDESEAPVVLENVTITGSHHGLDTTSASSIVGTGLDVYVNHCTVGGSTHAISNSEADVSVGASQLAGGAVVGGRVTCAGVFDEDYVFSSGTCP